MKKLAAFWRHDLVHNTLALYGVQACRKLLPLISIPYLARVLKPEGWGTVAFVASLGDFTVLAIEFGFNLSATREIAQNRDSRKQCGYIASGVIGSQLLLASVVIAAVALCRSYIPVLRDHSSLLWAGLFYGVAQGMNPIWFFQGLEKIQLAAVIEVIGKVAALLGLFIFVKSPGDEWRVLTLHAVPAVLATIFGFGLAARQVQLCWPKGPHIVQTLRSSLPMFLYRSAEGLYGVGNAFILGLFASPASVGYYSIAERISRAMFGLLDPIREALFPRLSHLAKQSEQGAAKLARIGAVSMIIGGVLLGAGLYIFAPLLIRLAGSGLFTPAVKVLRIFSILPPILAVTHSVGVQWLLSQKREALVNSIMLSAGVFNILLAITLAPRFMHFGMAWAVVCTEVLACLAMVWTVRRTAPFWNGKAADGYSHPTTDPLHSKVN